MWVPPNLFLSATGNDNASGTDWANAIATTDELANRLSDGNYNQNVNVTFGPGMFGDLILEIDTPYLVNVVGDVTDGASASLSTVTPQSWATQTRGAISLASGSPSLFQRLKVTSGAAAGALAYATKVLGSGFFNVDRFRKYNSDATGLLGTALTLINPGIGDTLVPQTLNTSIGRVNIERKGGGRIAIQDMHVITPLNSNASHHCENDFTDAISGIFFKGCDFTSGNGFFSFVGENMAFACCKFSGGVPIFEGAYMAFYGCLMAAARLSFGFNSFATFESSNAFIGTGSGVLVNQGAHVQFNGTADTGDNAWFDAASGNALEVRFGSVAACRGAAQLWGSGTYPNTIIVGAPGCRLSYVPGHVPAIVGGTHDLIIGGAQKQYTDLPYADLITGTGVHAASF